MTLMVAIIFIYGLFIGSFLNVCIYRIPEGKSVVSPPSSCGNCGHRLSFLDMIPVLNYFIYKGKCRYCGASFSIQYPLIELLNGILYLLIFMKYGLSLQFVLYDGIASLLIVISIIDLNTKTIPDGINLFGGIFTVLLGIYLFRGDYLYHFYGFLFGFLLFLLIAVVTNAMGGGDIKLMGVLGILFGLEGIIFTTVISFIYGAVISSGLIISGKASRKDFIPFGPFISLAALTYILVGDIILELYFNIIF
ncbi:leader peptidase (prepilin peptidase) / N-methyltransferase [Dethiosulfatibacter aminovorans DSM 17477]|uniref:Leader peptidase (Prepilin peptidase) / N-methyltransferase n=1 Tax=Dethiosulfatibacter aminovorans DSM 17477 TaxID=1121476 RepID=A0A1M6D7M2_9FIRM|nr:A24 family peptidase [Dethiosulfatibacter aminovorans]SHI69222.1 leader peptidase (prepilin peptidase) / N-methyltransferase [Dethiosulfatibacter aminovorans DSM 17477]